MNRLAMICLLLFSLSTIAALDLVDTGAGIVHLSHGASAWGDWDNDGDLDLIMTGNDTSGNKTTKLYRNDGGLLTDMASTIPGVYYSSVAWGDYDNDGDLDLFISGRTAASEIISRVYRNDNGTFTDIAAGLTGLWISSAAWGDYDNDGDLDIALMGATNSSAPYTMTTLLYVNTNGVFSVGNTLTGFIFGSLCWGDYDADGDLDLLQTGSTTNSPYTAGLRLYRNDNGTLSNTSIDVTGVYYGQVAWIDFDNDGDLDFVISGINTTRNTKLYENVNGSFQDTSQSFIAISQSYIAVGDHDNDGDSDIALAGYSTSGMATKLYTNNNGLFTEENAALENVQYASIAYGDYDNDGDLDILLTGTKTSVSADAVGKIYRNDTQAVLAPPTAPSNLRRYISGSYTVFQWDPSAEDMQDGRSISYAVRIGTSPGAQNLLSPMAGSNGKRRIAAMGNAQGSCLWKIKNASLNPLLDHYWSVQAVDSALRGSAFSTEAELLKLKVTSPNGGETWKINEARTVYWDRNPNVANVNIYLSTDDGLNWVLTNPTPISAGTGFYSFQIPSVASNSCRVKVESSTNSAIYDISDSVFSILSSTATSIQVSSQNSSGSTLLAGTNVPITWVSAGIDNVKIELTNNNGQTWLSIVDSFPAASGLYTWNVPDFLSQGTYIRVSDAANPNVYDWNDYSFKILRLRILSPNGGQKYIRGEQVEITWSTNVTADVKIYYSRNGGTSWSPVVGAVPGQALSYLWTIPSSLVATDQFIFKLLLYADSSVYDEMDAPMTVMALNVSYPNSTSIRLQAGKTYNITWSQSFVTSNLKLEYTTDGTNFTTIDSAVDPSTGSYPWLVPYTPSTTCKIRVSITDYPIATDLSDNDFTICRLNITTPNGGEVLTSGTTHTIRWLSTNVSNIRLDYSTNNGVSWATIISSTSASALLYNWTVPNLVSYECLIRIRDASSSAYEDVSDQIFTIRTPIIVVSPNGGENLTVGSSFDVTWTISGTTPFILMDYTINNGSTWLPVITEAYPSSVGSYAWVVPNTPSSNCKIRIKKSTDANTFDVSDAMFTITPTVYPPTPQFTADITEGTVPLSVQFTDLSTAGSGSITQWNWNFGDGGSSTERHPLYTYQNAGVYSVSLTVTNTYDSTATELKENYITASSNIPVIALLSSSPLDLGSVHMGEYTPWYEVRYQNIGSTDMEVSQYAIIGSNGFEAERTSRAYTLAPGQIDTIRIKLKPKALGTIQDTLAIWNSSGNNPELRVPLIGFGLAHHVPLQFASIQAAINAANPGNCIVVDDGVYYENLQIVGKEIILASNYIVDGDTLHISNTIIDGSQIRNPDQASVIAILPGDNPYQSPQIVGLTIRNGRGWLISETVGNTIVQKRVGGGIYIKQSNPIFTANKIVDNVADDEGGGSYAFMSMPNLGGTGPNGFDNPGGNIFMRNMSDLGKDIYFNASHTRDEIPINNCRFEVFCSVDTTLTNYWATTTNPVRYQGSTGNRESIHADLYVATNGNNESNTGLSADSPFRSIDYALSLAYGTAEQPVTIHVAAGLYSADFTGESFPLQMVDWVSIKGAGKENTVIDAGASSLFPARIMTCDKAQGVKIEDLTILNGYVTNSKNVNGGGLAIINSQIEINRIAINNSFSAGDGAGLYAVNSDVAIDDASFEYNQATGSGGGIAVETSDLMVANSTISHNFAGKHGGALYQNNGQLEVTNSMIQHNNANGIQMRGGGISLVSISQPRISNSVISSNSGYNGGGISMQNCSSVKLLSNKITNNVATNWGGAVYNITTGGSIKNSLLANNTASQRGGAIYANSSMDVINTTIANNRAFTQGGAIYTIGSNSSYQNSILWNNSAPLGNEMYLYDNSAPAFNYCDIAGGSAGFRATSGISYSGDYSNNLDSDPLFVSPTTSHGVSYDALQADWGLLPASPCVNAGNPDTDTADMTLDLAGNTRIISDIIDIGAFETNDVIAPLISASPDTEVDFGSLAHNSEVVSQNLIITNTGNSPLSISSIALETEPSLFSFSYDEPRSELQPDSTLIIQISFNPSDIGTHSNSLTINNDSVNNPQLSISLLAEVIPDVPVISSNPDQLMEFGQLHHGEPAESQIIYLSNTGTSPLLISAITQATENSPFTWNCSTWEEPIATQGTLQITISFSTENVGTFADTLFVANNSTNNPMLAISLSATVLPNLPQIVAVPQEINFGEFVAGEEQLSSELIIQNTGKAPLSISSIDLIESGSPFGFSCDSFSEPIAPDSTLSVQVLFNPSTAGEYSSFLRIISDSATSDTLDVHLTATVIAAQALISVEPDAPIIFNQMLINSATQNRQIELSNTGNAPLCISSLYFDEHLDMFSYNLDAEDYTINPGTSVTLTVLFTPLSAGNHQSNLYIISNSENYPSKQISVSASVIENPIIQQGNISLQVIGFDASLTWSPILIQNGAYLENAELYLVLYSEKADSPAEDYYFHGCTADTSYVHSNVARFRNMMFYRVVGVSGIDRSVLEMATRGSVSKPQTWAEIKRALRFMKQ